MPRIYVESWIFARTVVDTETNLVEELEVERLHENVRVAMACLAVDVVEELEDVPEAVANRARQIAASSNLAAVPWRVIG